MCSVTENLYTFIACFTECGSSLHPRLKPIEPLRDAPFPPGHDAVAFYQWTCSPAKCEQVHRKCFWRVSQLSQSGCCPCPTLFDLCHRYRTQYKPKYTKNNEVDMGKYLIHSLAAVFDWEYVQKALAKGNILFYPCFYTWLHLSTGVSHHS